MRAAPALALASLFGLAVAGEGAAAPAAPPGNVPAGAACAADTTLMGPYGTPSYWGPLPAPADSVTAIFLPRGVPLWHRALLLPYDLVSYPVSWVTEGLAAGSYQLYRQGVYDAVREVLDGIGGPFDSRIVPNFTAGGLLGWGGGLTVYRDETAGRPSRFKLHWQSTSNESHRVTLGYLAQTGPRAALQVGAGYRYRPNARYFGIGPFTDGEDESWFSQEMTWAGASFERGLLRAIDVEAQALFSAIGHRGPGVDETPALETLYAGTLPPGWGERSDGWSIGLSLVHETATETGRPAGGGLRRLGARRFLASDGSGLQYWSLRAEAQQFFPLWHVARALALRGFVAWLEPADRDRIHFQRLLTNDEPDLLRGYEDFRWRDQGMVVTSLEYRWPVWVSADPSSHGLDAYLFTDVGQVYGRIGEIALANLTTSFGGGLRLIGRAGNFNARIEVAASEEETVFRLRGDQMFQFGRGGLYHGRDPVPER